MVYHLALFFLLLGAVESHASTGSQSLRHLPDFGISQLYSKTGIIWTVFRYYYEEEISDARSIRGRYETEKNCMADVLTGGTPPHNVTFVRVTKTSQEWQAEKMVGTFVEEEQQYEQYARPISNQNKRKYMNVYTQTDLTLVDKETGLHLAENCYAVLVFSANGGETYCDLRVKEPVDEHLHEHCTQTFDEYCAPRGPQLHKLYSSSCSTNLKNQHPEYFEPSA